MQKKQTRFYNVLQWNNVNKPQEGSFKTNTGQLF